MERAGQSPGEKMKTVNVGSTLTPAGSYILLFPPGTTTDEGSEVTTAPAPRKEPRWRKLLAMHDFHETCEPGLPRKGVEPSDHVAIGAVVELF